MYPHIGASIHNKLKNKGYIRNFAPPFGDIYSRPGLALRDREIATIAALAAMGNATPQLKVHIEAGLNVGLSQAESPRF